MSDLTHLQRALRILQRLMTHDKVTVNELFDLFDRKVPKRTIQRTLQDIESANIPLTAERGPHGIKQYSIHNAFKFIPETLTVEEVFAALLLGQFSQYFAGPHLGRHLMALARDGGDSAWQRSCPETVCDMDVNSGRQPDFVTQFRPVSCA